MAQVLAAIHNYFPAGGTETLLGVLQDNTNPDQLAYLDGTTWTVIDDFAGTGLKYDLVSWKDSVYISDGKNPVWKYDGSTLAPVTNAPVAQYLTVFQDRLIAGGDSRTSSEVVADGGTWPVDSHKDQALYCETLEDTNWPPNNFIDCKTGNGQPISGLAINSATTSITGAQSQLVIFKRSATGILRGTLGSGAEELDWVSETFGCPSWRAFWNTPYGLMFLARDQVCLLQQNAGEPLQVGTPINIQLLHFINQVGLEDKTAMGFYTEHDEITPPVPKLCIAMPSGVGVTFNDNEWELDLRPEVFPNKLNWYGPHTGDAILQYEIYQGELIAAQADSLNVWKLNVAGVFNSMLSPTTARTSIAAVNRLKTPEMKQSTLDAWGIDAQFAEGVVIPIQLQIDGNLVYVENHTWTAPAVLADTPIGRVYVVCRNFHRPGHDAQIIFQHSDNSDAFVHDEYVRVKLRRRQSELQDQSTQT